MALKVQKGAPSALLLLLLLCCQSCIYYYYYYYFTGSGPCLTALSGAKLGS